MYVYPSGGWGGSANRIKLKISVGGHSISQAPKQPSPRRTPSTKPATMREASQQPSPGSPTANAFRIAPGLISELDALMQERYRKCWEFRGNTATRYIPLIKVEFMVNGALANEPMLLNPPQEPDLRGLAESALRAVRRCDPLSIPAQFVPYHQDWKSRILRFDPEEMAKSRESGTTQNARAIQNQQSQSSNDSDGNKPEEPDVKRFGFFAPVPKKELESSPKTSNTSPGNAQDSYTATLYGMIVPLVRVPPGLPPISRRRPLQVEFVVDGRGRLAGAAVTKSSGVPSLDSRALRHPQGRALSADPPWQAAAAGAGLRAAIGNKPQTSYKLTPHLTPHSICSSSRVGNCPANLPRWVRWIHQRDEAVKTAMVQHRTGFIGHASLNWDEMLCQKLSSSDKSETTPS